MNDLAKKDKSEITQANTNNYLEEEEKKYLLQKFNELKYAINSDHFTRQQVEELEHYMDKYPNFIWEEQANLTYTIIDDYLENSTESKTFKTIVRKTLSSIRKQLNYDSTSVIEKMMIDTIVLSWLQMTLINRIFTKSTYGKNASEKERKHWDQLLSSANKRYLKVVDTLVRLRKTGVNLQINIATNAGMQKIQQKIK